MGSSTATPTEPPRAEPPSPADPEVEPFAGLRAAIVHDWLTGMRGGERCLEAFCEVLPRADIFTLFHFEGSVSPLIERRRITSSPLGRLPLPRRHYRNLLPLFPWAIGEIDLSGYDLILSSSHCVAKGVRRGSAVHICYCHTPVRYFWDRFDDYFGPGRPWPARLVARALRPLLQDWDVRTSAGVDRFIANSAHVAGRISDHYGRTARVIHPPVDLDRFRPAETAGEYYLVVSALAPYKRIDVAIEAFARSGRPLWIAGCGPEAERLHRAARGAPNIRFLGWVEDGEVAELMARARAFILPGEEDFGIAPVESMAAGRPVIALGRGGARETVIDLRAPGGQSPTGVLFDTPEPEALEAAVELLESRLDAFAPPALRAHARKFSAPRFRAEIAAEIRSTIAP